MADDIIPVKQLSEMTENIEDIVRPLQLTTLVSNKVPKQVKPLYLPDKLPEKGMEMADLMRKFEEEHLSNYNVIEENQALLHPYTKTSTLEDMRIDSPISVPPTLLGNGLGSMVNNPKFARVCNPVDTEFEIEVCDTLASNLGLPSKYTYGENGVGIINANEFDGLLVILISEKFSLRNKKEECKELSSDKFVVYASNRDILHPLKRIAQMCDVTLVTYDSVPDLLQKLEDKTTCPLLVIYDLDHDEEKRFNSEIEELGSYCKTNSIWLHLNLHDYGCFSLLTDYKFLTSDPNDYISSVIVDARRNFGTSFESNIMWCKNRTKIYEGMHWTTQGENKFQYLSQKDTYTIDFKDYQVYLGKMNRAYKFWTVFNMYGMDAIRQQLQDKVKAAQSLISFIGSLELDEKVE